MGTWRKCIGGPISLGVKEDLCTQPQDNVLGSPSKWCPCNFQWFRPQWWPLCVSCMMSFICSLWLWLLVQREEDTLTNEQRKVWRGCSEDCLKNPMFFCSSSLNIVPCPLQPLPPLLIFFLSLSLNPHLSLLLPSVRSYRRAELEEKWVQLEKNHWREAEMRSFASGERKGEFWPHGLSSALQSEL